MVHDINRPDGNGIPPKMLEICNNVKEALNTKCPYLSIDTDDNLCSSVEITGSFDSKGSWINGIFKNSRYFTFFVRPTGGARYYEGGSVVVYLVYRGSNVQAFRRYTGTVDKVVEKLLKWFEENTNLA